MSRSLQHMAKQARLAKRGKRECPKCLKVKALSNFGKHGGKTCWCISCNRKASLAWNTRLKKEVVSAYGGSCRRCGENDIDVLTIDHINQKGSEHRSEFGLAKGGAHTWDWLRKNGYPKGFRVLCFNCNVKAYRIYRRKLAKEKQA